MSKKFTKIALFAFIGLVAVVAAPAPAQAQTVAELQALINQLQAQLSALSGGSSVTYNFTQNLTVGSTGPDVLRLQQFLNAQGTLVAATGAGSPGMETSYFGSLTQSAVARWQAANGISPAVGYFGPITRAAVNAITVVTVDTDTDTDTDVELCPNGMTLASNCTLAPDAQAAELCPNGNTLASNCTLAPGAQGSTTLTGVASVQAVTVMSQYANEEVGEGEANVIVHGREIEMADTGNARLQTVRLEFDHAGGSEDVSGSSTRWDRYADEIAVYLNGVEVARADASEFTRTSSGIYTHTLLVSSNAILNSGSNNKNELTVGVSALANIDSGDENEDWDVNIVDIRYVDATGAVITDTSANLISASIFKFVTLVTSGDVKLKVALASDNPVETTHQVSTTTTTKDVTLLKGTFQAQGGSLWLDEVRTFFTATGANVDDVVSTVRLVLDGTSYSEAISSGSVTTTTGCDGTTCTLVFDDLDRTIASGATIPFSVVIDAKDLEGDFGAGDSLKVEIRAADRNEFVVEDSNGDNLADSRKEGIATGLDQTFRDTGINVAMVSTGTFSNVDNGAGEMTSATFEGIQIDVTAFGDTFYISNTAQDANTATASNVIAFDVENSSGTSATVDSFTATVSTTAPAEGSGFRLDDGVTRRLTLNVTIQDGTNPADGSYRIQIKQVRVFDENTLNTATNHTVAPATSFETPFRFIDLVTD